MKKQTKTIEVVLDLGDLKPRVQKAAKESGISVNEFICNALQSRIRQEQDYARDNFTPHGGKHLMGKHTGYEVTKGGRYYPAPSWTGQFDEMFAERQSIYNLVNAVVGNAQERLVQVEKAINKAKERLIDDLGLDPNKAWAYYGGERGGYLVEEPKNDPPKETK